MKTSSAPKKLRGAGVYVFDTEARVLLIQRGPKARHQHYKWEGVGGQLEPGETFEQAALREFREELGIDVELGAVLAEFEEILDSNGTAWEAKIFQGSINQVPQIQEPEKCVGLGWFTKAEVIQLSAIGLLADYSVADFTHMGWL